MKSWSVRMFRGRRLDRNPLRRRSDRAETVIGIWLPVTLRCRRAVHRARRRGWTRTLAEHARVTALTTRYEVIAITLAKAPPASGTLITQTWVSAKWTAPDGRQRTGPIQVLASTQKGSSERIRVAGNGHVAAPPLR